MTLSFLSDPPADITEQPKNRSVFVSLSATFHCGASSLYPVIYSWQRVDSSVNITSQAIGLNTSTLVIPSVQYSDEGLYQCVTSVFGVESSSEPAYLTVKGTCSVNVCVSRSFNYQKYLIIIYSDKVYAV